MNRQYLLDQAKYESSNPISRLLIRRFHARLAAMLGGLERPASLLEVGCGEGRILNLVNELFAGSVSLTGLDVDKLRLSYAEKNAHFARIVDASVYALPFADNRYDAVLCTEVLEHLDDPARALQEIARVANKHVLLTVPNEPVWRILNMFRGAYWSDWGNTPGHLNHWSTQAFVRFVGSSMRVIDCRRSLPWVLVLAAPQ